MTGFFHAYDLRGKYPGEIGDDEAKRVGKSYGTYLKNEYGDATVLVGRDGRRHGETVTEMFIDGVTSTGVDVDYVGLAPTPVVYFGTRSRSYVSSTVVTASHNPGEYTGFKFSKPEALSMSRDGGMREIEKIYESGEFAENSEGDVSEIELNDDYVDFVADKVGSASGITAVVNYGNGVTSTVAGDVLRRIGCEVVEINSEIDGDFPNHLPDPGDTEARNQVKKAMEDRDGDELGIIFDGDGDRAGFVVDGEYIDEDRVIALFSEDALKKRKGVVVHDLRCSKLVSEKIKQHGSEPRESRVGHTFISEEIHRDNDAVFAGEVSGHYYFPVYDAPWDDGLFAAALFCRIASNTDIASKLDGYPNYPVGPELRIDCPESTKQPVIEQITEKYSNHPISTKDGVKIEFDTGWALVRPSNTQPKMSIRCEADSQKDLERIQSNVEESVREAIKNT